MKKHVVRFALAALMGLCVVPQSGRAAEVHTGTFSASHSPTYILFTTNRVGPITANITWKPKRNANYFFQLIHYTDPNNIFGTRDPDYYCLFNSVTANVPSGNWTCEFPDAEPGYWLIEFSTYQGTVPATYSIAAETD